METRTLLCSLFLSLVLSRASAVEILEDIADLNHSAASFKDFPRHGLMLLHWIALNVEVEPSGAIELKFDPTHGGYGFHCHSRNTGGTPSKQQYYSLGDLSCRSSRMFPFYVTQDFRNSAEFPHANVDRLLIRVQSGRPTRVDKMYLTEHPGHLSQDIDFNLENAYEIGPQLLGQIRVLSTDVVCDTNDPRLDYGLCEFLGLQRKAAKVRMVYPEVRGLDWLLTLSGYDVDRRFDVFMRISSRLTNQTDWASDQNRNCTALLPESYGHHKLKLEVESTSGGYARVEWSGIPESVVRMKVHVGLYKDNTAAEPLKEYPLNGRTYGSVDTCVPLNPGLQLRLIRKDKVPYYYFFKSTYYTTVWKGPELDEGNGVPPTAVRGYLAGLRLYAKDGYACARLYVDKSFAHWKNVFDYSWVGFYASQEAKNNEYYTYAWTVNFDKRPEDDCPLEYDVYEYESRLRISPGVQARFMLTTHYGSEKARTIPWGKKQRPLPDNL